MSDEVLKAAAEAAEKHNGRRGTITYESLSRAVLRAALESVEMRDYTDPDGNPYRIITYAGQVALMRAANLSEGEGADE